MPIKSGIGIGAAQIYDTSNLVNNYGKILAQQAKEREKFDADLADTMAKYSTKGLKEGDVKLTAESYKALKDKVTRYDTNNPTERAKAMMEATNGIQTIQDYAEGARNAYKTLDDLSGDIIEHPWKYKPEAQAAIKQLYANPYSTWSDEYKDLNRTKFERQPDLSSVQKLFETVNTGLFKEAQRSNQVKDRDLGKHIVSTYYATPEQASKAMLATMEVLPEAKYTMNKAYEEANPGKTDYTQLDVANFATQKYKENLGDNAFSFYGGRVMKPKEPKGDDSENVSNYQLTNNKTFVTSPVYDKTGKIISKGKPAITFDSFVTTPVSQSFATPQIGNAFNITDGKPEAIGAKKGLRITGLGRKGNDVRVTVVDDDEVEYYLKPEDVPLNIRNGKQFKTAVKALGGASAAPKSQAQAKPFNVDAFLQEKKLQQSKK